MTAVKIKNILADIPAQLPKELFTCLLQNEQVQIERIISRGQTSAKDEWYDQASDEWTPVAKYSFTYGANWISPSTPCVRFNHKVGVNPIKKCPKPV
jgi:hypothetical protein